MKRTMKQRLAILAVATVALGGIAPVASAAPADAYTILKRSCWSNGPYLACTKMCYVDYNWWEEVFLWRKYDGWRNCAEI